MPMIDSNRFEEWTRKVSDFQIGDFRERVKKGLTKPRIILLVIVALIILFFAIISPIAQIYTDVLWYNQVGFQQLFWKMILAKIIMVVVFGAFFFFLLYLNIFLARRIPPPQNIEIEGSPLESLIVRARESWMKIIGIALLVFSIIASISAGIGWAGKWEVVLKFLNHTSYGKVDPLFGKDIGFYMFSYPFQRTLVDWLISSMFFIFFVTVIIYVFSGGIRLKRGPGMLAPHVKLHLSVLLSIILLLKAWSYRLNMYEMLFSKRGIVWGAGYTDVKAHLPALWIMTILSIVCALVLLINIYYRGWLLPAIVVGVMIVVTIIAGTVYPLIIQNYRVRPAELAKEEEYLKRNIEMTREAYKLNSVEVKSFAAELNLDTKAIERNRATIGNIRLWDPRPILDTFNQLQSIRQYYGFQDVDVDRYTVNGVYRQTIIAARELILANLPEVARTWVNNTLVYTHGFGACLSPTNDVTEEGNPDFILKDIPPYGKTNVQIRRPEIYFGETSTDPVIVHTREKEFDYPSGKENAYTFYKGKGGVLVKSLWRKILFSLRFRDINILFSGQVRGDSRILYYRNLRTRLEKCAPFLTFDRDPYLVISDEGRLFWIADAYTTSDYFPYSQPTKGFGNYVRNSVKAVVDAYNGSVKLYVVDPEDPVIATYRKIFPAIFEPFGKMPEDLRKHVRYPEDLFMIQADVLRTYHMTDPRQFYNKEDLWDFPLEVTDSSKEAMSPYYVIMRLPGESTEEMVLMLPFVPHNKPNMIAWLGARMDGDKYGELINFVFPSGKLIYGPEQIEGRIEQEPEISRQLSLWRQAGSEVIRGNLFVIPIEESLIYVEPLYLKATQIPIPQLKRVIVVYGQQVVMETSLENAIARVFGGAPPSEEVTEVVTKPSGVDVKALAARALDLYNKAIEAQKSGDWASYGNYLNQLNEVLKQLSGQTTKTP